MNFKPSKEGTDLSAKTKRVLIVKGKNTSQVVNDVLLDFTMLSKPNCKILNKKNEILPFEDANSIEFLNQKNECSLFALGSHSKKRPNNLILGRLYDGHVLDMVEFGVDKKISLDEIEGPKKGVGSKPIILFLGDQWENDTKYTKIQNLLLDFFRGDKADKISLKGVDHVLACTVVDGKVFIRGYTVAYQKSNTKVPDLSLDPMGPFYDLSVRRTQAASEDMWKVACKKPKSAKPKAVKNVSKTALGEKLGRIHMMPQNLDKMGGRRVSALRNTKKRDATSGGGASGSRPAKKARASE